LDRAAGGGGEKGRGKKEREKGEKGRRALRAGAIGYFATNPSSDDLERKRKEGKGEEKGKRLEKERKKKMIGSPD